MSLPKLLGWLSVFHPSSVLSCFFFVAYIPLFYSSPPFWFINYSSFAVFCFCLKADSIHIISFFSHSKLKLSFTERPVHTPCGSDFTSPPTIWSSCIGWCGPFASKSSRSSELLSIFLTEMGLQVIPIQMLYSPHLAELSTGRCASLESRGEENRSRTETQATRVCKCLEGSWRHLFICRKDSE